MSHALKEQLQRPYSPEVRAALLLHLIEEECPVIVQCNPTQLTLATELV